MKIKYWIAKWLTFLFVKSLIVFFPNLKITNFKSPMDDKTYFEFTIDTFDYRNLSREAYKQIKHLNKLLER